MVTLINTLDHIAKHCQIADVLDMRECVRVIFPASWKGKAYALDLFAPFEGVDAVFRTCGEHVDGEPFAEKRLRTADDLDGLLHTLETLGVPSIYKPRVDTGG